MKKLTLDLDRLAVESFGIEQMQDGRGSVDAHQVISPGHSCLRTRCCPHTYDPSCADTCTCA